MDDGESGNGPFPLGNCDGDGQREERGAGDQEACAEVCEPGEREEQAGKKQAPDFFRFEPGGGEWNQQKRGSEVALNFAAGDRKVSGDVPVERSAVEVAKVVAVLVFKRNSDVCVGEDSIEEGRDGVVEPEPVLDHPRGDHQRGAGGEWERGFDGLRSP